MRSCSISAATFCFVVFFIWLLLGVAGGASTSVWLGDGGGVCTGVDRSTGAAADAGARPAELPFEPTDCALPLCGDLDLAADDGGESTADGACGDLDLAACF